MGRLTQGPHPGLPEKTLKGKVFDQRRPVALVYVLLSTLPCFAVLIASSESRETSPERGGGVGTVGAPRPAPPRPPPLSCQLLRVRGAPGTIMASSEEDAAAAAADDKETNNRRRRTTRGAVATAWLTFYNIAMTAGWLVLAVTMMRFYLQKGTHRGLYRSIARTLKFFQTAALVEVGHCAIGIVRTSVIVTGVQVCSRIFMVWFITNSIRQVQSEESVILFLVVWTVTEITRYSYYTFNLLHHLPYFIKWARVGVRVRVLEWVGEWVGVRLRLRVGVLRLSLSRRYNLFIVLYPLGVVGELLTIYAALPVVRRTAMYSLRLPNKSTWSAEPTHLHHRLNLHPHCHLYHHPHLHLFHLQLTTTMISLLLPTTSTISITSTISTFYQLLQQGCPPHPHRTRTVPSEDL
ncbi:hypothetical protein CRUP_020051 [Coryphaenoides rupestris]|nr:hypothetical protein CRUP_020051 [Coryphaenoides rupestris]